jgi:hypothetical protein
MIHTITYINFNIQCLLITISFLFSLKLLKIKREIKIKKFVIYNSVAIIVMLPMFLFTNFSYFSMNIVYGLNNFSLIFGFSFLSLYLISIMPKPIKILKYLYLLFTFFLIVIIYLLIKRSKSHTIQSAFAINHLGLVIFSLIYFIKLFNDIPDKDLLKDSNFWIVIGIFFCSIVSYPLISLADYLSINKINLNSNVLLLNVPIFCYSIMHLMFIKSFLCSIRL